MDKYAVDVSKISYSDDTALDQSQIDDLLERLDRGAIDECANIVANWLLTKMYGADVRASLAQWALITAKISQKIMLENANFKLDMQQFRMQLNQRQEQLEDRQDDIEDQFRSVIANATADSEVILARDSTRYGNFETLDARLEHAEQLISAYVPSGFDVTIKHNQSRNPDVKVRYYEYALGTEPDGLGTGPKGSFGGINNINVPVTVDYIDTNTCTVHLPIKYKLSGKCVFNNGLWYIIDSYRTLSFDLGDVNADNAEDGNEDNTTGGTDDVAPSAPQNLRNTHINESTEKLDWD